MLALKKIIIKCLAKTVLFLLFSTLGIQPKQSYLDHYFK